jgi:hypothetical protein
MKFEYKIVEIPDCTGECQLVDLLNKEGFDGWEAIKFFNSNPTIGAFPVGPTIHKIIFKKQVD